MDPRTFDGELLWPERFPFTYLEEDLKPSLRAWGGSYAEAGQLQQRPAPRGGGMFKAKDFQFVDKAPTEARRVRAWDLAATKDAGSWTVGLRMSRERSGKVFIEHVRRLRGSEHEVNNALVDCAKADTYRVLVSLPQDPGQAGKVQKRALASLLAGFHVKFSLESGEKADRARPLAAQSEAGNLYLVKGAWNDDFISEACNFPNGKWTDQIDAASRAFGELISRQHQRLGAGPTLVGN
jgi:predicted phage terminase large subunit-like protein